MSDPVEEAAERLYGLPLDEFTAARNATAKELRSSDREAAERVKGLRKPTQGAWALNQVARRAPDAVDGLLAAGEELRRVQEDVLSGAAERDALRAAVEAEREAVSALLEQAERVLGSASAQVLERVRETLHAAVGDPEVARQLSAGALVEEHQAVGLGGFGGGVAPARPRKKPAARKPPAKRSAARAKKSSKAKPDEARARAAAQERERKKAEREARRQVDAARKRAERARRELNAAERDRERAETAFRSADRAYAEARERCEEAAGELEQAHEALAAALPR